MAIPGTPSGFYAQTANATVSLLWNISAGATSYDIQRSLDGVTYASIGTATLNTYLDTTVSIGVQYYYQVAAVNASGTSPYTSPSNVVPAPISEMSLLSLREAAKQKADRIKSNFVTPPEWNTFIGLAMYELYDLLITSYEDYFMAPRARFVADGSTFVYPLPNGALSFTDVNNASFVAQPFYKLLGVDLGLNTANNAFVTMDRYNLIDRNKYVYPTAGGTIYGVFSSQYRILANNIEFIPTPTSGQQIQLLYIPRLPQLLQDTDLTTLGFSGWLQYVIVRAAKYALDKEESDTSKLDQELLFLNKRIEAAAQNRDAGRPDTISDTSNAGGMYGNGFNGPIGGW